MKINEVCIVCRGNDSIGLLVTECGNCYSICQKIKCAKKSNYRTFRNKMYFSARCISSQDSFIYNEPQSTLKAFKNCIQDTLSSHAHSADRPSARECKGILHTNSRTIVKIIVKID